MEEFENEKDLQVKINEDSESIDVSDRVVGEALRIINEWDNTLQVKLEQNDLIDEVLEDTMTVIDRDRNAMMPSYLLQSVRFKIRRRMQPPDWKVEIEGVTNEERAFIEKATVQKMREGEWQEFMTGKWGIADKVVIYGDAFGRIASFKNREGLPDGEKAKIVTFQNTGTAKLYWDIYANGILNPGGEGEANQCVATYIYSWEEAINLYPAIEELATIGKLPETEDGYNEDDMSEEQKSFIDQKKIELGFFYDKSKKIYAMIAGRNANKIFEFSDNQYPFVFKDGESYLPFLHFYCFAGVQGFYNSGVCGLFYALDAVWTELMNRGAAYIMQNTDPIQIINLPSDKRADFYQQLEAAQEAQEIGGRPFIVNELNDPNYGKIYNSQSASLTNDFERLVQQLRALSDMLGVKLDELTSTPGKPLGTTELELANQNETVKAIINNWRGTIEFAVKVTMDAIMRDIDDEDDEIVEGDVEVTRETDEGEMLRDEIGTPIQEKVEGVTMGDVAKLMRELAEKNTHIKIKINVSSGATKNDEIEISQITNELQITIPGTLHYNYLRRRLAELRGFNVNENSFNNPQAQMAQAGTQGVSQPTQREQRLQLAS